MSRKTRNLIWSAPLVAVLAIDRRAGPVHDAGAQRRVGAGRSAEEVPGTPHLMLRRSVPWTPTTHRADVGSPLHAMRRQCPMAYRIDYSDT